MTSLKDMIIDKFLIVKNKQTNEMLRILIHGENHFSLPLNALDYHYFSK